MWYKDSPLPPSFLRKQESTAQSILPWIPAFAGMTAKVVMQEAY